MDELISAQAIFNANAEQSVLGSMLLDPRCIPDILSKLTADDFYIEFHQKIYAAVASMSDTGAVIDPITLQSKLPDSNPVAGSTAEYLGHLLDITPTAAHVQHYALIVREKAMLRTVQSAAREAAKLAAEGASVGDIQAALQRAQEVFSGHQSVEVVDMPEALTALYGDLKRRQTTGSTPGLKSGYDELDLLTGGFHPGNMIALAARSGMGKSALALNIATDAATFNHCPVLIFSLEMTATELTERVLSRYGQVDLNRLRDGRVSDEDWFRLGEASGEVCNYPVSVVESPSLDMVEIARICRSVKPALVIIDHIGLVRPSGKYRDRREAVDSISRSIKCLAKDLHIPIIAVAQLNRAIMSRTNKTPVLSDLRESGAIEQDADVVMFLDRPNYYDPAQSEQTANLIIAKNRHGKTSTIPLLWHGAYQHFAPDWTQEGKNGY